MVSHKIFICKKKPAKFLHRVYVTKEKMGSRTLTQRLRDLDEPSSDVALHFEKDSTMRHPVIIRFSADASMERK